MRISPFLLSLALCLAATPLVQGQDPGAQQDAEAAREKLLKAADQLDNIQANSEATKTSVEGMKTDVAALQDAVTKLQADNAALKQQVADLQAALEQFKADQIKDRQTLIDNVASLIAASKASFKTAIRKKEAATPDASMSVNPPDAKPHPSAPSSMPGTPSTPPDSSAPGDKSAATSDATPAPVKAPKGYYHVVVGGETLTLICAAYRDHGVNVTVSEIRKANGLTAQSVLKAGQKLFIPKPGT